MKQASLAVNAVLLVAIIVLYILFFQYKNSNPKKASSNKDSNTQEQLTNIAYFNTDSVNSKVDYIKRNADALAKKEKNMDAELKRLGNSLQTRMENFQKKAAAGGYSQVTGEAESKAIANQQASLEKKNSQYMSQLMKEQEAHAKKLQDALKEALKEINEAENFDYIFSYSEGGAIFQPNDELNITDKVVKKLNSKLK